MREGRVGLLCALALCLSACLCDATPHSNNLSPEPPAAVSAPEQPLVVFAVTMVRPAGGLAIAVLMSCLL